MKLVVLFAIALLISTATCGCLKSSLQAASHNEANTPSPPDNQMAMDCHGNPSQRINEIVIGSRSKSLSIEEKASADKTVALLNFCVDPKPTLNCNGDVPDRYLAMSAIAQSSSSSSQQKEAAQKEADFLIRNCFGFQCPANLQKAIADLKLALATPKITEEGDEIVQIMLIFLETICPKIFVCPCNVYDRVNEIKYLLQYTKPDKNDQEQLLIEQDGIKKNCLYEEYYCSSNPSKRIQDILNMLKTSKFIEGQLQKWQSILSWLRSHCFLKREHSEYKRLADSRSKSDCDYRSTHGYDQSNNNSSSSSNSSRHERSP